MHVPNLLLATMPELPEVETTRRGIAPYLLGRRVVDVVLRRRTLRWPIPEEIDNKLPGQRIEAVRRRAKYLLLDVQTGSVILHLGMTGSLRVLPIGTPARKHDHVEFLLDDGHLLRLTDPRRFGAVLWQPQDQCHALLARLGPEPLSEAFDAEYLYNATRGRKAPIKPVLMDQHVVVGVGNIYANEALFVTGIHPARAAGRISLARCGSLVQAIKDVLLRSIEQGGTTFRDFLKPDGEPGYFAQELFVYGRAGQPCRRCGRTLRAAEWGQRATVYCPHCQH